MSAYHLINNNCNHFSDECCLFLTGKPLPSHITGLPQEFINTPFGQMMIPIIDQMFSGGQNAPVQGTGLFGSGGGGGGGNYGNMMNNYGNTMNTSPFSFPSNYPSYPSTPSTSTPSSFSAAAATPAPASSSSAPSPFPIITASKVFLYETASFDRIVAKLIENADAYAKSHPSLSPSDLLAQGILNSNDYAFLKSAQLRDFLTSLLTTPASRSPPSSNPTGPHPLPILPSLLPLLRRIFSTWSREQSVLTTTSASASAQLLLPAIDLLRIVCLHSEGAACVCNSSGGDNPLYIFNVFRTGFYTAPSSGTSPASTSATSLPPASDALRLMSARMAVNLFATPIGTAFVMSASQTLPAAFAHTYAGSDPAPPNVTYFLTLAGNLIQKDNVPFLRQVAACLIHNIAVSLRASEASSSPSADEHERTHELLNEYCVKILGNEITKENARRKAVEKVLAKAGDKKDPKDVKDVKDREDTLTVFLKALGVILLDNDVAEVTFASLGREGGEEMGGKEEESQTQAQSSALMPYEVLKGIKEDVNETVKVVKDLAGEIVGMLDQLM